MIGCVAATTKLASRRIVKAGPSRAAGIGERRMIEDIEKFGTELSAKAVAELPILSDGKIPVTVARIAEDVATRGAECSSNRGHESGSPFGVAAEAEIGSRMPQASSWEWSRDAIVKRERVRAAGEVFGIAKEIPRLAEAVKFGHLAIAGEVIACILSTPGQTGFYCNSGIDGPALEDLPRGLPAGQTVS